MSQEHTPFVARETLQSHGAPPTADNALYMHRSETTRPDGVQQHVVAGVHVVFKPQHANNLFESFNTSRDQKLDPARLPARRALLIACDTLEIWGPLSLPEWDVAIFARKLVFRNQGHINTTPLNWVMARAADYDPVSRKGGAKGADGRHAGAISVFVDEVDVPTNESPFLFIGRGGKGQDAGHGRNGDDGRSLWPISNKFQLMDTGRLNTFTASFANPCVFATYHWHWIFEINRGQRGENGWPTSGQDALEPGVPGSGSHGAAWVSNQKALATRVDNTPGEPGITAPSVRGGAAGTPTTSTHYDLTIRFDLASDTASGDNTLLETRTTTSGKSYEAKGPSRGKGDSSSRVVDIPNAWVHPLQLESVLRYARDLFLAGSLDVGPLLTPYESALAAPLPTGPEIGLPWIAGEAAAWTAAQAEIASILHRLRNNLDYFGNPAGYMPLLSLPASMQLYDLETKDAIRTLLLARWVQDTANKEQSAANAFGSAIDQTNTDTARVAEQLVQAEAKMESLDQQMTGVTKRLEGLSSDLAQLRSDLYNEAAQDLQQKAAIRFGVKMAAAICQVIPVGQPVLGTLGKLASFAADIEEEGTPDTLSKMGDTIKKAREAAKKAKKSKEEAKKKQKDAKDTDSAKKQASVWEKAGDGLGPALSMAGEAIGAMHVSEQEVEAELAKLIAASPKWQAIVERIRTLNKDKARIFTELSAVLQAIGDGYARLAANADALVTMQRERSLALGKLSVAANQVIARMGQTARLSLQRSLYLLVKSYETTVLKPIEVDWSLDLVFDKITDLLAPVRSFDAKTFNAFADAVAPLFEENRKKIKNSLILDYGFASMTRSQLEFGFTTEDTPALVDALRGGRPLIIDPLQFGVILPVQERAKAVAFECKALVFGKNGPPLPASGNAIVRLSTDGDGTVRRGEHLYAVRSDAPRVWTWTYHFSDGKLQPSVPAISSLDLLNLILESADDDIKEKLAAPPAWSGLTIDLEFSPPLRPDLRPVLEQLLFVVTVDALPAPSGQRVLDIRTDIAAEHVEISPADLAGRGDGVGNSYRIYDKAAKVSVKAPSQIGGRAFSHWDVVTSEAARKETTTSIELLLDSDALAFCRYQPAVPVTSKILERFGNLEAAAIEREIGGAHDASSVVAFIAAARAGAPVAPRAADQILIIRTGPGPQYPAIGLVADGEAFTLIEEAAEGWRKIISKGVVGYIRLKAA